MTPLRERDTIRLLHLVLSIPVVGYISMDPSSTSREQHSSSAGSRFPS